MRDLKPVESLSLEVRLRFCSVHVPPVGSQAAVAAHPLEGAASTVGTVGDDQTALRIEFGEENPQPLIAEDVDAAAAFTVAITAIKQDVELLYSVDVLAEVGANKRGSGTLNPYLLLERLDGHVNITKEYFVYIRPQEPQGRHNIAVAARVKRSFRLAVHCEAALELG